MVQAHGGAGETWHKTSCHTHTVDATNRALSKGGLNVLSLVRCNIKTKTYSNVAPGAFLRCKDRRGAQQQLDPSTRYSLWQRCWTKRQQQKNAVLPEPGYNGKSSRYHPAPCTLHSVRFLGDHTHTHKHTQLHCGARRQLCSSVTTLESWQHAPMMPLGVHESGRSHVE